MIKWVEKNIDFDNYYIEYQQQGYFRIPAVIWFKHKHEAVVLPFIFSNEMKSFYQILDDSDIEICRKQKIKQIESLHA